jgi:hypothetical protein
MLNIRFKWIGLNSFDSDSTSFWYRKYLNGVYQSVGLSRSIVYTLLLIYLLEELSQAYVGTGCAASPLYCKPTLRTLSDRPGPTPPQRAAEKPLQALAGNRTAQWITTGRHSRLDIRTFTLLLTPAVDNKFAYSLGQNINRWNNTDKWVKGVKAVFRLFSGPFVKLCTEKGKLKQNCFDKF